MEISEVFRDELKEEFARLEIIILDLEKGENFQVLLDQAKRILHNMKGSARVAGFEACGRVIHQMETLLIEKPIQQISEHLLAGIDVSLCLTENGADESEAERFIERTLHNVPKPAASAVPNLSARPCQAARAEVQDQQNPFLVENIRLLVCGDRGHLLSFQSLFTEHNITLQWSEDTAQIALLLQEQIFDAVVLDFSCLQLTQGCAIRKIRRVSQTVPIILLAESMAPCLLVQVSRLENVSCFWRPLTCPHGFMRHLHKRIIMARQTSMFSRALRTIWFLDPQQDPKMEQDARLLMRYQDAIRAVGCSHQEWDFENHSQKDQQLILHDVHQEIELVLHDLILRIDQKVLPLSLIRMRHRHLLDCILQHFLEENAMMGRSDHNKKFLEQHVRHHQVAMQEFHGQRMLADLDGIRFFCDQAALFLRQHASFDQTLEEYLLRESA